MNEAEECFAWKGAKMKKIFTFSTVAVIWLVVLLYSFGFFYVNVSQHNTYKLDETELGLIENAISRFRERVDNQNFDEIRDDLSKGRRDEYWEKIIFEDIRNDRAEFGRPRQWEFFRCARPQVDSKLNETVYHLDYLTTFDSGEMYESFIFVRNVNNEVNLINTDLHLPQATEWRIEERDKHKAVVEEYPNEIIIPYADRYIEFRY